MLRRLRSLYLGYNRISKIETEFVNSVPYLQDLVLTRNNIKELSDLLFLKELKNLVLVSFVDNPVTKKKNYRLFVIWLCPWVRTMDFNRVRDKV
jgi:U2 small nuclear ribonucleoprotein A'